MPYERRLAAAVDPYAHTGIGASDRGYLAEAYPAILSTGSTAAATAGRLEFIKIQLPSAALVTNIVMFAITAGGTLTSGQNFAVLYNSAGVRVGVTADQTVAWGSTGLKTMALAGGPFSCAPGFYFASFWYNGTTCPAWMRAGTASSLGENAGFATPNLAIGFADTGLTTTSPSPMGAQTAASTAWWAALS